MRRTWVLGFPMRGDEVCLPRFSRGPFKDKRNGYGGKGKVYASPLLYGALESLSRHAPLFTPEDLGEGRYAVPRITMVREMASESGSLPLRMESGGRIDVDFDGEHIPLYLFRIRGFFPQPRHTGEMRAPEWFPAKELPLEEMIDGDRLWVPELIAGKQVYGNLVMRAGRTLSYVPRQP